uniref:Terpene synthase N-terminal domain-containing protein n=1 Tax=Solanum lycopersicum TaxID=4081 RepID=A0A3Q7JU71_SOLLC
MLVMSPSKSIQKFEMINTIQRLGVDYYFEHEIQESLSYLYEGYEEWIDEVDDNVDNLHVVTLRHKVIMSRVTFFRKFTDEHGNYKEALVRDVQGMLSLYEAAQFRVHNEKILDEAMNFTNTQLKLILPKLNDSLAQQVSSALKFSIRDGMVVEGIGTREGIYFEPQYSVSRKILTKVLCFCSIMADTYDTYGTLDELTLLPNAIE